MKVRITREVLLPALAGLQQVTQGSGALPILGHILLQAEGGHMRLTATDLDTVLRHRLPAQVYAAGSALLPAKLFCELVKSMEGEELDIAPEGKKDALRFRLECGGSAFRLAALAVEQFPTIPPDPPLGGARLPLPALARAVNRMLPVVGARAGFALGAGVLRLSAKKLRAMGTEGHRIVIAEEACNTGLSKDEELVLTAKGLRALADMEPVGGNQTGAAVTCGTAQQDGGAEMAAFTSGETTLLLRKASAQYPDCVSAVPRPGEASAGLVIGRASLDAALHRLALLSGARTAAVQLEWEPAARLLTLALANPDLGAGTETLRCEPQNGHVQPGKIYLGAKYLAESVAAMEEFENLALFWEPRWAMVRPAEATGSSRCLIVVSPCQSPA